MFEQTKHCIDAMRHQLITGDCSHLRTLAVLKAYIKSAMKELEAAEKQSKPHTCYVCPWSTDKCKNRESDKFDQFVEDISCCTINGTLDNSESMRYKVNPHC